MIGKRLDQQFEWIFGSGTKYFIPIISKNYVERPWTQHEWSVAIRETECRKCEFILPLRLDDTLLVGLPSTIGYIDLRELSLEIVTDLLIGKLEITKESFISHWVAAFGVLIEDILNDDAFPESATTSYANLCDWLTDDILKRLSKTSLENLRLTEDMRDGECFSIRIEFNWKPDERPLEFPSLDWWDVLEILPYDQVYNDDM